MAAMSATGVAERVSQLVGRSIKPRDVTMQLYHRRVPVEQAPIVGGRRMIDESLIPAIAASLATPAKRGRPRLSREG